MISEPQPVAVGLTERRRQFESLVGEHYESVWSYMIAMIRDTQTAEDLTQQAFLVLFERLRGDRGIGDVGLWLRGVARNLAREWWREQRQLPASLADQLCDLAEEAADASTSTLQAERAALLSECLQQLSLGEQRVVAARYRDGLPITRLAERERLNVATVRVRLFRIRERLKSCVEGKLAAEGAP